MLSTKSLFKYFGFKVLFFVFIIFLFSLSLGVEKAKAVSLPMLCGGDYYAIRSSFPFDLTKKVGNTGTVYSLDTLNGTLSPNSAVCCGTSFYFNAGTQEFKSAAGSTSLIPLGQSSGSSLPVCYGNDLYFSYIPSGVSPTTYTIYKSIGSTPRAEVMSTMTGNPYNVYLNQVLRTCEQTGNTAYWLTPSGACSSAAGSALYTCRTDQSYGECASGGKGCSSEETRWGCVQSNDGCFYKEELACTNGTSCSSGDCVHLLTVSKTSGGNVSSVSGPDQASQINCGSTCNVGFYPNTAVTLTAIPSAGYLFAGWSNACTGTGTCSVTMDGAKTVIATFSPMPTCSAFSYSDWGSCAVGGTQTRTVATSSPEGCTGGSPSLTQSCTYVQATSTCSSFTYSAWGNCASNSTQTRTVVTSSPSGCTGGSPSLTQSCTYVQATSTCSSFTYSAWGNCASNGTKIRTVTSSSPSGCTGGNPNLTTICDPYGVIPTCSSFDYSSWGTCSSTGLRTRTITDAYPSNCTGGNPTLTQSCIPPQQYTTCTAFTYSAWGTCSSNSLQSRTVTSTYPAGCTGGTPVLNQGCIYSQGGTDTSVESFIGLLISLGIIPQDKIPALNAFLLANNNGLMATSTTPVNSACINLTNNMGFGSADVHFSSNEVTKLQNFLVAQSLLTVVPNGYFGPNTLAAVKAFQANNGIEATGYVGVQTRTKIKLITCGN